MAERAKAGVFDAQGFYQAIDAERMSRNLNWKQVAEQSGMSASTLTRLAQGKKPDVDSMSALIGWSGLDSGDFIRTSTPSSASNFSKSMALLRSDPNLGPESSAMLEDMLKAAYERLRKE
jgi:transcriptional regulator with XRE-family HTH domain